MQDILWILFYAGRILSLVMTQFVKQMKIGDTNTSGNRVPCDRYLTRICNSQFLTSNQGGGGREGNSIVFHLSFLTHSACQYDVT